MSQPVKLEATSECMSRTNERNNDKSLKHPPNSGQNQVQPLSLMCYKVIASKLERYPPQCLGIFSEIEWERVVKLRHQLTEPKKLSARKNSQCLNGVSGRMTPAISEKFLVELEQLNHHLSSSEIVDKWIWKDIVEYKFRRQSPSRPVTLLFPWTIQVDRLKDCGKKILQLLSDSSDQASSTEDNDTLQKCLETMQTVPMNVPLLTATCIGKTVHKFLKHANKRSPQNTHLNLWAPINISKKHAQTHQQRMQSQSQNLTVIEHLENILKGWKRIASADGVAMQSSTTSTSKNSSDPLQFSGRSKQTTEKQHAQDIAAIQTCNTWRQLYSYLSKREDNRLKKHGARMREIRQNLENNRSKVGKINTRTSRNGRNLGTITHSSTTSKDRLQAVLSGKPLHTGLSSSSSQFPSMSKSKTKILQLRKEAKHVISRQGAAQKPSSSFGSSVACASNSSKKRAVEYKGREITFGGGKKMKLPKASSKNSSNTAKRLFSRKSGR